jgi:hypothetical protein
MVLTNFTELPSVSFEDILIPTNNPSDYNGQGGFKKAYKVIKYF